MKLSGSAVLHEPAEQVVNSMQDPRFLVRTITGCQQLKVVGPDEYQMTINAGAASIKGTYLGNVRMAERAPIIDAGLEPWDVGIPPHFIRVNPTSIQGLRARRA